MFSSHTSGDADGSKGFNGLLVQFEAFHMRVSCEKRVSPVLHFLTVGIPLFDSSSWAEYFFQTKLVNI